MDKFMRGFGATKDHFQAPVVASQVQAAKQWSKGT